MCRRRGIRKPQDIHHITSITQVTAVVRDGKIVVVATEDLSDGTEVTLLIVRNGILQDLDSTEDPQEAQRISQAMEAFE